MSHRPQHYISTNENDVTWSEVFFLSRNSVSTLLCTQKHKVLQNRFFQPGIDIWGSKKQKKMQPISKNLRLQNHLHKETQ